MERPMRRGRAALRRVLRPTTGAAAVAALLASLALAPPAHASVTGHFCPAGAGTIGLQAYGSAGNSDRCAGAYHSSVLTVYAYNGATSVMKCAVLKPNSNGSGGDVGGITPVCAPNVYPAQTNYPGLGGYPTMINMGANYHTGFNGGVTYN